MSRRVKREKAGGDFFLELLAPREPARSTGDAGKGSHGLMMSHWARTGHCLAT